MGEGDQENCVQNAGSCARHARDGDQTSMTGLRRRNQERGQLVKVFSS